jgi:hypothetical protein
VVRGSGWESGEGWQRVKALIELAKQERDEPWTAEQRERMLRRILAKVGAARSGETADHRQDRPDADASETACQVAG